MVATNILFPQCLLIPWGLPEGKQISQFWLNLVWPCGWQGLGRVSCLCLWGERGDFRILVRQRPPSSTSYQMAKALPEISISVLRPSSTQWSASYSAGHPLSKNEQERNTTSPINRETASNHNKVTGTPKHTTEDSPAHQKDKIQPHPPEHRHQSPPPGKLE